MHIGMNIRKIRKEKDLTQKQVAEKCGMADSNLRTYELGRANPKPSTVAKIAEALGVSPAALYGVEPSYAGTCTDAATFAAICGASLADGAVDADLRKLVDAFDALNWTGRQELVRRAEEMAFVPSYRKSITK